GNGAQVSTGCHDATEETRSLAAHGEDVAREVVSRLGGRLVVRPSGAPQIRQAPSAAAAPHDHVGEVDGPAEVALATHHGRCEQVDTRAFAVIDREDVLQPAHDPQVGLAAVEHLLALL